MARGFVSKTPKLPAADAARLFLQDMAQVSGFTAARDKGRNLSAYVIRKPLLTVADPWFYAGLVALESTKVCDMFEPEEAGELLREISAQIDGIVDRRGRRLSTLVFVLMGRVGYGAILMGRKVPDEQLAKIILVLLGRAKDWAHLIPTVTALRQVRAGLSLGAPSWWQDDYHDLARTFVPASQDNTRQDDMPPLDGTFTLSDNMGREERGEAVSVPTSHYPTVH